MSNSTALSFAKDRELKGQNEVQGFGLNPKNLNEAIEICEYISKLSIVPKAYKGKPQDILVAINFGYEVGLQPLQSLNSVAVVNGTPSLYGDAPLGLVKQSPDFEYILEDNEAFAFARDNINGWSHLKNKDKNSTSNCVVKRKNQPPIVREFSTGDVKKAGLGNVHKSYPKTMRKYRARSRTLRDSFPDVLKGLQQAEINEETEVMIEAGHYDDLNLSNEVQQPEDRQTVDIDVPGKGQPEQQDESPQSNLDQEQRDQMMAEITAKAKDHWGKEVYFAKIKRSVVKINEEAANMLDLSDSELERLHDGIMGLEAKAEEE